MVSIQIQKAATFNSGRKTIKQILQPKVINYFSTHSYIVYISKYSDFVFLNNISRALDFPTFLENMKLSSSLSKILETGINVFKSNSQIMKNSKYYKISAIYKCVEKYSMTIVCNIWMICLELNRFVYDPSWMLHLFEFVRTLRSSVLVVFNNFLLIDATARSKISSDQKRFFIALSVYPLSFFANTPFNSYLLTYLNLSRRLFCEFWIGTY